MRFAFFMKRDIMRVFWQTRFIPCWNLWAFPGRVFRCHFHRDRGVVGTGKMWETWACDLPKVGELVNISSFFSRCCGQIDPHFFQNMICDLCHLHCREDFCDDACNLELGQRAEPKDELVILKQFSCMPKDITQ